MTNQIYARREETKFVRRVHTGWAAFVRYNDNPQTSFRLLDIFCPKYELT